ncbi:aminopeptidase P N-terminal domain-containing protein [candidate division KSB1 bacterium]
MKKRTLVLVSLFVFPLIISSTLSAGIFEKSEYSARRTKLMQQIPDGIAIILGAQLRVGYNEHYQNNDFMYFSGVTIPNSILIIDGINKESILFFTISERGARNEGISLDLVRDPKNVTGIEKVYPIEEFSTYLEKLRSQTKIFYTSNIPEELMRECKYEKLRTLRRTMENNEWDGRMTREQQFIKHLKTRYSDIEVKDCSQMITELRIIKSPAEIEILRKAAKIAVNAHIELMRSTGAGMHEYELASLFEYYCKKEGANDLAYYTILCSGENHPYLHYYKYDRVLEDGDFLVVDAGPDFDYYDIDITVSYPVNGRFTPRQREIYETVLAVHNACISLYKPGLTISEVRTGVEDILTKQGFDLSDDVFQRMRGGFGHYVGMAVHDVGGGPSVLKPGMVFANEPFAVFPDENLGVRVENTILITEDGCEVLTKGIPRTVEEIEALMKQEGAVQALKKAGLY